MTAAPRLGGMVPAELPVARATGHLDAHGRLSQEDRARLRRIPSVRNAIKIGRAHV